MYTTVSISLVFRPLLIVACDSVQIERRHFLRGSRQDDLGRLRWSQMGEIRKTQNETKKQPATERLHFTINSRHLQLFTSNHSPQNWGMILMGCVGYRVRQTTVVGSQTRLTRYLRELELASQRHRQPAKPLNMSFHAQEPTVRYSNTMATVHRRWKHGFDQSFAGLPVDLFNQEPGVSEKVADRRIMIPIISIKALFYYFGLKKRKLGFCLL